MVTYSTRHISFNDGIGYAAGGTYFNPVQGTPIQVNTEINAQCMIRATLTASYLFLHVTSNTLTASSTLVTRVNGANGNLTVSVGSGTTGIFEDTSDSDSLTSGQLYNYEVTTGSTGTSMTIYVMGVIMTSSSAQTGVLVSAWNTAVNEGTTDYLPIAGCSGGAGTEAYSQTIVRSQQLSLSYFRVRVRQNTLTASSTYTVRKNGANGNESVSVPSSTAGSFEDTTDTDSAVNGDALDFMEVTGSSGTSIIRPIIQILAVAAVSNVGIPQILSYSQSLTYNTYAAQAIAGKINMYAAEGDSGPYVSMRYTTTFTNLYVYVSANTLNSGNSTVYVRKNTNNGNGTVSIAYGTTGSFEDTTDTDQSAATDYFNTRLTTSGTSGSLSLTMIKLTDLNPNYYALAGSGHGSGSAAVQLSQTSSGSGHGTGVGATKINQVVGGQGVGHGLGTVLLSQIVAGVGHGTAVGKAVNSVIVSGLGRGAGSAALKLSQVANGFGMGNAVGKAVNNLLISGRGVGHAIGTVKLSQVVAGVGHGVAAVSLRLSQVAQGIGRGQASVVVTLSQSVKGSGAGAATHSVLLSQSVAGFGHGTGLGKAINQIIVSGFGHGVGTAAVKLSQVVNGVGRGIAIGNAVNHLLISGLGSGHGSAAVSLNQVVKGVGRGQAAATFLISQVVQGFARGKAVALVTFPFQGLIGKASSFVRGHVSSSRVRQHGTSSEVRQHKAVGEVD